jgi:hypothetical protein
MNKIKIKLINLHSSTIAISLFWITMVILYVVGFIFLTHS